MQDFKKAIDGIRWYIEEDGLTGARGVARQGLVRLW